MAVDRKSAVLEEHSTQTVIEPNGGRIDPRFTVGGLDLGLGC
jgi:hypothetical protein